MKPGALVRHLSVGERQRVEILKSLYRNARVLILDEPTAVLVPQEVEVLFETLKRLQKDGMSLVFISHKLNEVMAICDRITVLRNGRLAGTVLREETSPHKLASMMVGRETFGVTRQGTRQQGEPILRVENLSAVDKKGLPALKNVSLEVHRGEILGIAGVSGNGQTELAQVLSGMLRPTQGRIQVGASRPDRGRPGPVHPGPRRARPGRPAWGTGGRAERRREPGARKPGPLRPLGDDLDRKAMLENAQRLIKEYQIKASPGDHTRTLSGGNMQKVLFARALSQDPQVVIASQPTRGLDVGATDYIRTKLLEQRDAGAGVLLISEDLDEVMALSDRIAVIYEGEIVGMVPVEKATGEQLGLMMSGATKAGRKAEEAAHG